jgi:hypothetical protein
MQTSVTPRGGVAIDDAVSNASAVSWAAVFAGAAAAAALSYILVILGFGLGLSSVSPWTNSGASTETIGIATILWLTLTQIVASGMGGYLAGRLRVKWVSVHTDEVYFRDTAHGFLSWAIASLVVAAFLASAIGGILSGGASAVGRVAGGATQAAAAAAPGIASMAHEDGSGSGYFVDSMFRANPSSGAAAAPINGENASATSPTTAASSQESQGRNAEVARIFAHSIAAGSLAPQDKQYLSQIVAARTGLSQTEADQRVDAAYSAMTQSLDAAKAKAKEAADQARKLTAGLSLWMFISLLCGAFFASLAATFGGRRRDLY